MGTSWIADVIGARAGVGIQDERCFDVDLDG